MLFAGANGQKVIIVGGFVTIGFGPLFYLLAAHIDAEVDKEKRLGTGVASHGEVGCRDVVVVPMVAAGGDTVGQGFVLRRQNDAEECGDGGVEEAPQIEALAELINIHCVEVACLCGFHYGLEEQSGGGELVFGKIG